jgi:hypothetical protein
MFRQGACLRETEIAKPARPRKKPIDTFHPESHMAALDIFDVRHR